MKKEEGSITCEECVFLDADDISEDTIFEIYDVLEKFGLDSSEVIRAQQTDRQADGVSCKTGAMSLLRNALLELKYHNKTHITDLYPVTEDDDERYLDLPPTWTWGEQIFHYSPERLAVINPRDLFSSKEEKRASPRMISVMREIYKQSLTISYFFHSKTDHTETFKDCPLPAKFTPAAPQLGYNKKITYNVYLCLKGRRDHDMSEKYLPIEPSVGHKDKKARKE